MTSEHPSSSSSSAAGPPTSTSSHPAPAAPDPTTATPTATTTATVQSTAPYRSTPERQQQQQQQTPHATTTSTQAGQPAPSTASPTELARLALRLTRSLRQFPDFPSPGILFEDIFPLFADPALLLDLNRALELLVRHAFPGITFDAVVGLEARGFLLGPSLAAAIGAGFAPVRKRGKLPGPTVSATYTKEYGTDEFEMQEGAVRKGGNVLIVDDIIATGGSAAAAGELISKLGAKTLGYVFLAEIPGLGGRDKLDADAPVHILFLQAADRTAAEQEATHKISNPAKEERSTR